MRLQNTNYHESDPMMVRLARTIGRRPDGTYMVALADEANLHLFLTPGEMSELGHRFIELAAQADELEHGPLAVA